MEQAFETVGAGWPSRALSDREYPSSLLGFDIRYEADTIDNVLLRALEATKGDVDFIDYIMAGHKGG